MIIKIYIDFKLLGAMIYTEGENLSFNLPLPFWKVKRVLKRRFFILE